MKKTYIKTMIAACALLCTHAVATTINFEGVVANGGAIVPVTPYTESGFTFTNLQASAGTDGIFGKDASNSNGTATFVLCSFNTGCGNDVFVSLASASAAPFSLSSISAGSWQDYYVGGSIDLVGHLIGGGTVNATVSANPVWGTYAISGFNNLSSVDFYGRTAYAVAIDNLEMNATAVPEPASMALLGLGLAGLAAARRRKSA